MWRVSPHLSRSEHMRPIVEEVERLFTERGRKTVTSCPPRHGKTVTIQHAVPWMFEQDPTLPIAYITYAAEKAEEKSYEMRMIAEESARSWRSLGFDPPCVYASDRMNLREWRTTRGGMFKATGIGGPLTGSGFRVVLVDDAFKGREEAASRIIRTRTINWFDSVAFTRRDPKGTSFLVNATRWHPDDLSGQLIKRPGWRCVNIKAIDDARPGKALWPEAFPLGELEEIRENNPYEFSALYQGEPRSRGDAVFSGDTQSGPDKALPSNVVVGLDFAYSANSYSDFSVAVFLRIYADRTCKVVHVLRQRGDAPSFKRALFQALKEWTPRNGGRVPRCRAFIAGTELGVVDFMKVGTDGIGSIPIEAMPARGDKLTRAQSVAAAWNRKEIFLPNDEKLPEWVPAFEAELASFTGVKDDHDDQVDALAAAYVPLAVVPTQQARVSLPRGWVA
jgi:predicted phage terminase large subunit-like protein